MSTLRTKVSILYGCNILQVNLSQYVFLPFAENLRFQPVPKNGTQEQLLVEETEELTQLERMEMLC